MSKYDFWTRKIHSGPVCVIRVLILAFHNRTRSNYSADKNQSLQHISEISLKSRSSLISNSGFCSKIRILIFLDRVEIHDILKSGYGRFCENHSLTWWEKYCKGFEWILSLKFGHCQSLKGEVEWLQEGFSHQLWTRHDWSAIFWSSIAIAIFFSFPYTKKALTH